MATVETAFEQIITPVTHDLGAFKVNRSLPARERTMVGPFIFVDEFGPARLPAGQGMDVRPHPHINLATVTYLFDGAIEHRDSIGSHQVIEPGAINLMTAGSGIVHSERSPQELRPDVHAAARRQSRRAEFVDEDERADHRPLPRRERPIDLEVAEVVRDGRDHLLECRFNRRHHCSPGALARIERAWTRSLISSPRAP